MKLRNKETGEIGKILKQLSEDDQIKVITDNKLYVVKSLAELNEEWEDCEDKDYYFIDSYTSGDDRIIDDTDNGWSGDLARKEIGNYFKTRKEAEKAVEKLKAWKRLKDKGFRFISWYGGSKNIDYEITSLENETYIPRQICDDLDLLFGGEDD